MISRPQIMPLFAGLSLLVGMAVQAAAGPPAIDPGAATGRPPAAEWSFEFGGLGLVKPVYEGADEYEATGFPNVDIRWRDTVFLNGRDGLGVNIVNDDMFKLSASVTYGFGRDEGDSDDLRGLGDIDGGATAIAVGSVRFEGFALSARASHQFTGDDTGFLAEFGPSYNLRTDDGWFVNTGLNATFASGEYMDAYFGVSAGQAGASGLPVFDPGPGIKSLGANLLSGYAIDGNWTLIGTVSYDRLVGDSANSPITQDENQFTAGLGVSWRY